jgi:DNA-binding CsgD family transcriptional regulator
MIERCPTCGHRLNSGGRLTPRELDVLTAWWMVGSVKAAAHQAGVGEQRAKNLLSRARNRNGVATNDELLEMHFASVRSLVSERMSHNKSGAAA